MRKKFKCTLRLMCKWLLLRLAAFFVCEISQVDEWALISMDLWVFAGHHGSDLPVCGGCVSTHQLLQLQLLAVCGSVCGRTHLPANHSAWQTQAGQGNRIQHSHLIINSMCYSVCLLTLLFLVFFSISSHCSFPSSTACAVCSSWSFLCTPTPLTLS